MERRKFLTNLSLGTAGMGLAASCTGKGAEAGSAGDAAPASGEGRKPAYMDAIKPSFNNGEAKDPGVPVVLALIGAGSWGTNLLRFITDSGKNIRVKYICDVDDTRGGSAIKVVSEKLGSVPVKVRDMRRVFDDPEVDAVIIATPQHWHGLATIWACQAGKDVYVEKCISMNIREGQKMIEAAMKYERVVQCGMQNRSAGFARSAREYIASGALGKIVAVNVEGLLPGPIPFKEKEDTATPGTIDWDMWLGPAPKVPYNVSRNKSHGYYWDYSGGLNFSNDAIHQVDLMRMVIGDPGFPVSAYCTGNRYVFDDNREIPDYQMATFDYQDFVVTLQAGEFTPYMVKTSSEIRNGDAFPEWMQNSTKIVVHGTEQQMYIGRMGGGWQAFSKAGEVVAEQYGRFTIREHLSNFIDCVRSREMPNSNIVEGHNSSVLMHLANFANRCGNKQLLFSPDTESVTNENEAVGLSAGTYRKGYELPEQV